MASTVSESIGAMQLVQTLSLEDSFIDQFSSQNKKSLKEGVKARRLLARLQGIVQVLTGVSTALVLVYGSYLILGGQLSAGELLVFLSYLKAAFKPMQDFAKYSGRLAKASASGERVMELFNTQPDVVDEPDARIAPRFEGAIEFDRVGFSYEPGSPVLRELSFSIAPGLIIALVGPSGAGKSTIIRMLSRLYDPDHGQVLIDGMDIRRLTLSSLREQIAVVMQETTLFATSVSDNIAYGRLDATDEEIVKAAKLSNAHEFIVALPEGYETVLGERGATLSAGQRQRIAVARAAISNAPILILDEPTSGLDEKNSRIVVDAVRNLLRGRTVIMITHQPHEAARADRVLYIEQGRVVESGTHSELLEKREKFAEMTWIVTEAG